MFLVILVLTTFKNCQQLQLDAIRAYLDTIQPGTTADWNVFASKLYQVNFSKKQLIIKAGQVEDYLYFVERGMLRFFVTSGEKEITTDFAFEGNFTSAYSSFITRRPTIFTVAALTDVSLWRIHWNDLQEVYHNSPAGQALGRIAAEQLFVRKTEREVSLLRDKPEERYKNLLEQNPQLVQQIPLKYLASYIGITPQALSRIRARVR